MLSSFLKMQRKSSTSRGASDFNAPGRAARASEISGDHRIPERWRRHESCVQIHAFRLQSQVRPQPKRRVVGIEFTETRDITGNAFHKLE
jgi:hypothetical protein